MRFGEAIVNAFYCKTASLTSHTQSAFMLTCAIGDISPAYTNVII